MWSLEKDLTELVVRWCDNTHTELSNEKLAILIKWLIAYYEGLTED